MEIQKLLGVNMFDMERHLEFFGLGGMLNFQCRGRNDKHPYMIKSTWQKVGGYFIYLFYLVNLALNRINGRLPASGRGFTSSNS